MKHIYFIDPLAKLNIKKDSTLMMAITSKQMGIETYLLFEEDFYITNEANKNSFKVFDFNGEFKEDSFYLNSLELADSKMLKVDKDTTIHMRIDPPFDTRYQRYLWMLDFWASKTKCKVVNDPIGIMKYNEKITGFASRGAIESYVGSSASGFEIFVNNLKSQGVKDLIIKPLDLYSGIGVEKFSMDVDLMKIFKEAISVYKGAIVAQPFIEKIYEGEIRSIFLNGSEIGTILKTPPKGQFLANIAQGAAFKRVSLSKDVEASCIEMANRLLKDGLNLIAFDILADSINEVNVTCPGLMVEVSTAIEENLCRKYIEIF